MHVRLVVIGAGPGGYVAAIRCGRSEVGLINRMKWAGFA